MTANPKTMEYLKRSAETLAVRGAFHNGREFRPTQGDAIHAYQDFLNREDLTPEQKLKGFFEIPTGVGKTAVFLALLDEAHRIARAENDTLRVMIVVPTIPILEQMEEEVTEWAPDYLETVGFYGGRSRKMGDELTVITYDSWVAKMEAGEIDSTNVDILISDEAHRGTSERRLMNMFNAFANGTAQLAFTATARFDEEKSVEQSHGQQIFSRGVGDSVRLGELASYVQTQLYVIRVQPLPPQDVIGEDEKRDADYEAAVRAGMKQEAWMKQMVAVWRDGRDEHTGDLLTDNKSGFYVFGTQMADRFAELASADPVLQQRAAEKGCTQVIAAVHSKMNERRQREILDAFKSGQILGLVSDEKLKEGFNFPAMKNVFDYQRASLVDKAQIIGRAARQWWNPEKDRNEGATIIDSIVYVGSNDPEQDKKWRDYAVRNAIMAWSVLDGTAVFVPKEDFGARTSGTSGGGGGGVSAVLGLDVTSHISLEELQAIYADQKKLQEDDTIPFTSEMRKVLKDEIQRTGLKPKRFLKKCPELGEFGIADHYVIIRLNGGVTISQSKWDKIIEAYRNLPNYSKIPLSSEMKDVLKAHMDRTDIKSDAFVKKFGNLDDTINRAGIDYLFRPETLEVEKDLWDWLIAGYERLPDNSKIEFIEERKNELRAHMIRTGVGAKTFLSIYGDLGKKVNHHKINNMFLPSVKTIEKDILEWLVRGYEKLPDAPPKVEISLPQGLSDKKIPLTDGMKTLIKQHIERSGIGLKRFMNKFGDLEGYVTPPMLTRITVEKTKSVTEGVWNWLIEGYESLPDKKPQDPTPSP